MRDVFTEIWESVRRNKLRTTLTGFAVSWGIFMLIVLLGAGNGLMNSFMMGGSGFSTNSVSVGGGWTSKPYDGYRQGRRIKLDDGDIAATASEAFADHVEAVTATVGTSATVSLGKKSFSGYIDGQYPAIQEMSKIEIRAGRFLNDKDIAEKRKVVVLPENTAENLLENGQSAASLIGRNVKIGSLAFTVVGISKSDRMRNDNLLYAPFTTVKTVYGKGQEIGGITFSTKNLRTEADNEDFECRYKAVINQRHHAAPDDERAIWVWNRDPQHGAVDNRPVHPPGRHRGREQHYAHHSQGAHARIRHTQGHRSQPLEHHQADYRRERVHHGLLRLPRDVPRDARLHHPGQDARTGHDGRRRRTDSYAGQPHRGA